MRKTLLTGSWASFLAATTLALLPSAARATILGETGNTFHLCAQPNVISTGDGDSMFMWLYARGVNGRPQYPGPTILMTEGDEITITLTSVLPVPTSLIFPGLTVTESGGAPSSSPLVSRETLVTETDCTRNPRKTVTYHVTASAPGTYLYQSGSRPDLQVEMGLAGTIIVRPSGCGPTQCDRAYGDASTRYDREYLLFLTDADPLIHQHVAFVTGTLAERQAAIAAIDLTRRRAVDWFINGRNFPDTVTDANAAWLPTQPYNALPQMHPGERVLMRMVSAGADPHPFHTHGQNHLVIARDAKVLSTNVLVSPNPVANLAISDYTTTAVPGETVDAIWGPWTGAKLGWDIFGTQAINPHTCTPDASGFDPVSREYCADHNKPIPVQLPPDPYVQYGPFYGGTAYLGVPGTMPPLNPDGTVHVDKNPLAALCFMWHSHSERELTTNDIFIGGMATMAQVLPTSVPIP
jgi:hypothetical protein